MEGIMQLIISKKHVSTFLYWKHNWVCCLRLRGCGDFQYPLILSWFFGKTETYTGKGPIELGLSPW